MGFGFGYDLGIGIGIGIGVGVVVGVGICNGICVGLALALVLVFVASASIWQHPESSRGIQEYLAASDNTWEHLAASGLAASGSI